MDQQKLRNLVFEKTGVRIDVDDPVFALVALNEAVLEEAVERHIALMHEASAHMAGVSSQIASAPPVLVQRQHPAVLGGAAMLGAVLVMIGQVLFFRPAPPPPVVVQTPLTAEQTAALRDADRLNKVIEKLDKRTRGVIAAELAKP